ncbi:hypothetical protein [Sphingopyxis alaskensis]|uniref:hypothetical protein n=1 Tax=Sphingopyxis alaskensis TaxID=117207 RepID=UPI003919689D
MTGLFSHPYAIEGVTLLLVLAHHFAIQARRYRKGLSRELVQRMNRLFAAVPMPVPNERKAQSLT